MKTIIILLLLAIIIGCASVPPSNVVMVNPQTGAWIHIAQPYWYGVGLSVAAANVDAANQQKSNIKAAQMMGYTEMRIVK